MPLWFSDATAWLWPDASPRPRATAAAWLTLGVANVLYSVLGSLRGNLNDFGVIVHWVRQRALHVRFEDTSYTVDYPPHGWLVLTPLTWVPDAHRWWLVPMAASLLMIGSAWLLATWATRHTSGGRLTSCAFAGMFLSAGATTTAIVWGTNSPIAFLALAVALHQSQARPWLAAAGLAVGLYKLNVAAAVVLVLLLAGHWRTVLLGTCGAAGLTWWTARLLDRGAWTLCLDYLEFIRRLYLEQAARNDTLGLRRLLQAVVERTSTQEVAYVLIITSTLAALGWVVYNHRRVAPATCAGLFWLWGLIVLPQGPYNMGLALIPVWLWMAHLPAVRSSRVTASLVVLYLVANPPEAFVDWMTANIEEAVPLGDLGLTTTIWDEFGRFLLWALAVQMLRSLRRPPSQ